MRNDFIKPRYVTNAGSAGVTGEPVLLTRCSTDTENTYSEAWLQNLLHTHPSLLPANAFEASFDQIFSVARELPTEAGLIDNFFITVDGDIVLAECKLWRNPEARRKVIAQIIDYASALSEWDYEHLCNVVNQRNGTKLANPLYEIIRAHPEAPEEDIFIDNVIKNLGLGRYLLLIVGDGIREDLERLTGFLQQHANLQFTLGLLEIGVYRTPETADLLVIPNVILKTTLIERGIFTIDDQRVRVNPPAQCLQRGGKSSSPRGEDLTEIKFFETLSGKDPASASWLRCRLEEMRDLGIIWDLKKSLLPRYMIDGEFEINFGFFKPDGSFWTQNATWVKDKEDLKPLSYRYIEGIAALVAGSHIVKASDTSWRIYVGEKILTIRDLIGKEADLIKLISDFISAASHATQAR